MLDEVIASVPALVDAVVQNIAPDVRIVDNGSDASTVRLRAEVQDRSAFDTFVFNWSITADSPIASFPGGTSGSQIEFSRAGLGGIVTATVTVTDDDLGVGTDKTTLVIGSNQSDAISVAPSGTNGTVEISVTDGTTTATAEIPDDNTVLVLGQGGNDTITISPLLSVTTLIDAGAGNDTVFGGTGADLISGGVGNDSIVSGAGPDVIDASEGDDTVDSGQGDDVVLIGGFSDKTLIDSGGPIRLIFRALVRFPVRVIHRPNRG